MNRLRIGALLTLVALAASAVFATSALATPGKSSPCTGCHDGVNVPVTATLSSASGSSATYDVSAPSATAYAVFDGSTKVTAVRGTSGQITLTTGKTYTVFAVKGPSTSDGVGTTSVSPVAAPPVDTTAPVTTSNAAASYVSMAAINLSVSDVGGSGVAATYHRLDGGAQTAGTSVAVSALGSHTLEFWSVDVAGNAESHKTVTFAVTAPAPAPVPGPSDTTAPVTTSNAQVSYVASAAITLTATDADSGVAATYYNLDGGAQTAGTAVLVSTVGTHTLKFWSVDVAGNIEAGSEATFVVTAPAAPPVVKVASALTIRSNDYTMKRNRALTLSGVLKPATHAEKVSVYVKRPGSTKWSLASTRRTSELGSTKRASWSYRYKVTRKGTYRFQVRFAGDADSKRVTSRTIKVSVR